MLQVIAPDAAVAILADAQPENALAHVRINFQSLCAPCPTALADTHNLASQRSSSFGRSDVARMTRVETKARVVVLSVKNGIGRGLAEELMPAVVHIFRGPLGKTLLILCCMLYLGYLI